MDTTPGTAHHLAIPDFMLWGAYTLSCIECRLIGKVVTLSNIYSNIKSTTQWSVQKVKGSEYLLIKLLNKIHAKAVTIANVVVW